MICLPCTTAADLIHTAAALPSEIAETLRAGHALCVGAGSCACQHRVAAQAEKLIEEEIRG